jgi:hypothetical protein
MRHLPLLVLLTACDPAPPPEPEAPPIPAERAAEQDELLAEARKLAAERDARWRQALVDAMATPAEEPDSHSPCPVDVGDPVSIAGGQVLDDVDAFLAQHGQGRKSYRKKDPWVVMDLEDLEGASAPRSRVILDELEALADPERSGGGLPRLDHRWDRARELAQLSAWTWDLTILVVAQQDAAGFDEEQGRFEGGAAVGHAFVYDHVKDTITCAGAFLAQSSETIRLHDGVDAKNAARVDLLQNVTEGAVRALVAVESPDVDQPSPTVDPAM